MRESGTQGDKADDSDHCSDAVIEVRTDSA